MRPKYLQVETTGRDRWMISYMDVLTILLIFFVAIAAKSLEPLKTIETVQTIADTSTVPRPLPILTPIQGKLEAYGLDWRADSRGLVISLPQAVLFRPGKAQVNRSALPIVGRIADVLLGIPNQISLAGHADPVPIHNRRFRNNVDLAAARSLELLNLLTTRYQIAESRFSISSYGSANPRDSNDSSEGRANNRSVEILILNESASPQKSK